MGKSRSVSQGRGEMEGTCGVTWVVLDKNINVFRNCKIVRDQGTERATAGGGGLALRGEGREG